MMRWPPWPPISTKKFEVVIVAGRLEGLDKTQFEGERRALVEVKWKGQKSKALGSLRRSVKRNFTKEGGIRDDGVVELQEEFRSLCSFSGYKEGMFYPWELSFTVFDISLSILEMRATQELSETVPGSLLSDEAISTEKDELSPLKAGIRKVKILGDYVSFGKSKKACVEEDSSDSRSSARRESLLKKHYGEEGGDDIDFDRRQLSSSDESSFGSHHTESSISEFGDENFSVGIWEHKEVISRDGHMKLQTQVFFASIDQRSECAAGESACTALVAVIADWLKSNRNEMPVKCECDSLIRDGSLEWRTLCDNEAYIERFPDKHFDLETILQAKIRPLSVVPEKSFIGFFHPEELENRDFDFLQGSMSFDSIWDEISHSASECAWNSEPLVYIVSWNDHFFVLKVEQDAFYIIDTVGERLYEGCNQAYIPKFDQDTTIQRLPSEAKASDEKSGNQVRPNNCKETKAEGALVLSQKDFENSDVKEEVVCKGREACKDYIKSFLAAIPIRELLGDLKKGLMASTPLHHRLQIEFQALAVNG
ncbi:uncharacterized protein Pyn_28259 [Prunus yedoensis var. nudiflora]|uniref:C2 NT-type domain-containing protein n=1 Tax=Prunus yedoensis var. nudiflora TaxID=2094558 RepID=A0A314ZJS0_PRUYE|nr:uncharacterized protein Pyn_28259 [Prunus yedoensis var. nudiflora]